MFRNWRTARLKAPGPVDSAQFGNVNRRGFLQCAATIGAAWTVSDCGGSPSSTPDGGNEGVLGMNGLPDKAYFDQVVADLNANGFGTPQIMIDLDRLDANSDTIANGAGRNRYRIVEKSLPSIDLLTHISMRTGSTRFLVLHLPFLPALLNAFPTAQVLVGKVQTTNAVGQFFQSIAQAQWPTVASQVTFLTDSTWRLAELTALASSLSLTLQVGVEIDVGIHRSGVRTLSAFPDVMGGFMANPTQLRFMGLLGYDGHVTAAPAPPGLEETSARAAFRSATATYQSFVDVLNSQFGSLVRGDLIFNSGGTETFPLYTTGPVNDVATGGGHLMPGGYSTMFISALQPAVFIAAPVLNHFDSVDLPFIPGPSAAVFGDMQGLEVCGGGWAADFISPPGVQPVPIESGPTNENLVPNQSLMMAPSSPLVGPGDWIIQYPHQADAIFQFEKILLIRGGRLQSTRWGAYPRRY